MSAGSARGESVDRGGGAWSVRALLLAGAGALPAAFLFGRVHSQGGAASDFVAGTYPLPWTSAGLLAYVAAPLSGLGVMLLFMLPGLLLTRRFSRGDFFLWVVQGFTASVVLFGVLIQALSALGLRWSGAPFGVLLMALTAAVLLVDRKGSEHGRTVDAETREPLADPAARPFLVWTVVALAVLLVLLAPKVHWESLNGDGTHAFESIRLLLERGAPFWPEEAGVVSGFPGVTSVLFIYPGAVIMRLLGPIEAAARLPAFLYLVPTAAGLLAVARRAGARVTGYEVGVTWVGVSLYLVVMGFSATYNAYTADLALPATQDTLLVVTFLGFVMAFLDESLGWMVGFAVLSYLGLPSGPLLIVFWCGAAMLFLRPVPWRVLIWSGVALAAALAVGYVIPVLAEFVGTPPPGDEYAGASLRDRLSDPVFRDVRRILYWAIPCGIAPAAFLLLARGQSAVGRSVAVVTLGYFAFFYIQSKTALHYYAPAMLLPWIVFWSHDRVLGAGPGGGVRRWLAVCLTVAVGSSWPLGYRLDRTPVTVGAAIDEQLGGYDTLSPGLFAASELLEEVVPLDWNAAVPDEAYGGSPLVWLRYSNHGRRTASAALLLTSLDREAPEGARLLRSGQGAALYVLDEGAWQGLRELRPPTLAGARIYRIPQSTLF